MTLDLLFPNFDELIRTPEDVGRLNQAILDLAVRGRLVPQDPNDESASELVKQIEAEKKRLASEGKYRGDTQVQPMENENPEFETPQGWVWVQFGTITISRDGERIPVSKEERSQRAKTFDYYGASGVIDKIDDFLFDKPLLLIGEDGANLINRSTPIAFIARGQYWVNNHAHVIDGISEDFLSYLELFINAIDLKPYVTGTAQPKMNQAKMNSIPVALPPLAEQRRIVAKVDELFAQTRALAANLRRAQAEIVVINRAALHPLTTAADALAFQSASYTLATHFDQIYTDPRTVVDLRQTILDLAVRGKLVEQDPNDEPASALVRRVEVERDRQNSHKENRAALLVPNAPHSIPRTWAWVQVGHICDCIVPNRDKPKTFSGDIPWITLPDFDGGLEVHGSKLELGLTLDEVEEYGARIVPSGSVIMSCVGRFGIIGVLAHDSVINQQLHAFLPPAFLNNRYLAYALKTQILYMEAMAASTTILYLNKAKCNSVPLPLPPLAEQHRIVAKVDQLLRLCDELEAKLTTDTVVHTHLLAAALRELLAASFLDVQRKF